MWIVDCGNRKSLVSLVFMREVAHFHNPQSTFCQIYSVLPGGYIAQLTTLYSIANCAI